MSKAFTNKNRLNSVIPMVSGTWISAPSLFRLRLTGTGAATIDARNRLGTITAAVATFTATSATNQIEFPYLGDDAVELRATFPVALNVEVLA